MERGDLDIERHLNLYTKLHFTSPSAMAAKLAPYSIGPGTKCDYMTGKKVS